MPDVEHNRDQLWANSGQQIAWTRRIKRVAAEQGFATFWKQIDRFDDESLSKPLTTEPPQQNNSICVAVQRVAPKEDVA